MLNFFSSVDLFMQPMILRYNYETLICYDLQFLKMSSWTMYRIQTMQGFVRPLVSVYLLDS